jgi:hypothetical protein
MAEITHFYDEDNTLHEETSANTRATATNVVSILGSSLSANTKYLIIVRALIGIDSAANKVSASVDTPDDTSIESKSRVTYEMERTGNTELKSYLFVHSFTTDASPQSVTFRVWRANSAGTARADQASILLIDLDELGFHEKHGSPGGSTGEQIYGGSGTNEQQAQSFKVRASHDLTYMMFRMTKSGSPTDNLNVEIATTAGGSAIGTSDAVAASSVPTAQGWVRFDFSTPVALTAGTQYYARVVRSGSRDATNFCNLWHDLAGEAYGDGDHWQKDSGSWTQDTGNDLTFRAGSGAFIEDINAATGTEISTTVEGTTLATLVAADLGTTEEWLLLGYAKIGIGSTGRWFNTRLKCADDAASATIVNLVQEEGEDTAEERVVGMVGRHKAVTSNVAATITAHEEAANGNMTDEGSYLIALAGSTFADYKHDFQDGTIALSGTGETTVATVGSYTPTTNGNHLIIGRFSLAVVTTRRLLGHLEDGTTETRTGDSTPTHTQVWDSAKDGEAVYTMERISISAAKTYNLRGATHDVVTASVHDRWLLVLNLNLAAAGAQTLNPGVFTQALTAVDPKLELNLDPTLYTQLLAEIDPALKLQATPGLYTELLASIAPTVNKPLAVGPYSQLLSELDPTLEQNLALTLFSQALSDIDPGLELNLDLTLFTQAMTQIAPAIPPQIALTLFTQALTDIAPALQLNLTPTTYTELLAAIAPALRLTLAPTLYTQAMTEADPFLAPIQDLTPPVITQALSELDPALVSKLAPSVFTQALTELDPVLSQYLDPTTYSQLLTQAAPAIELNLTPGLFSQLMIEIDPTVSLGGGVQTLDFTSQGAFIQLLSKIDPDLELNLSPTLFSQLLSDIDPDLVLKLLPGLFSQLAAGIDPVLELNLAPAVFTQSLSELDPKLSLNLTPALFTQLLAKIDPSLAFTYLDQVAFQISATMAGTDIMDMDEQSLAQLIEATMVGTDVLDQGAAQIVINMIRLHNRRRDALTNRRSRQPRR